MKESFWLDRPWPFRLCIMANFRHLMQRECFTRFLGKRRHQRRLWNLAKAQALSNE